MSTRWRWDGAEQHRTVWGCDCYVWMTTEGEGAYQVWPADGRDGIGGVMPSLAAARAQATSAAAQLWREARRVVSGG